MATLNLGRIKPIFKGAYAGGTAYVVDDIVTSGNECFICILASTGNATSNATYWTKLAAKGTDGTDVGATLTTQGDILFRDGSGLQRLAKGTGLQQLRTNAGATAPEWATITGGSWTKIATADYSSGVTNVILTDCFSATYPIYQVYISNVYFAANNQNLHCNLLDSSAAVIGNWVINVQKSYVNDAGSSGSDTNVFGATGDNFYLLSDNIHTSATEVSNGQMTFYQPYESVNTQCDWTFLLRADNSNMYQWDGMAHLFSTTSARSLKFYSSSGTNFNGYKITVLGLNR